MGDEFDEAEMLAIELKQDLEILGWSRAKAFHFCCFLVDRGVVSGLAWKHGQEHVIAAVVSAMAQLERRD
jgi:hypothetical protein